MWIAAILGQTFSPSSSPPSPAAGEGGIPSGVGLVVFALLLGGLILMRAKLLRR